MLLGVLGPLELDGEAAGLSPRDRVVLLALGEPDRAASTAGDALALWRGRPFEGLEDREPATLEATRLLDVRRAAEDLRLEALLGVGRSTEVLDEAPGLVAEAPLRERRWALLATALYQAGPSGRRARDPAACP